MFFLRPYFLFIFSRIENCGENLTEESSYDLLHSEDSDSQSQELESEPKSPGTKKTKIDFENARGHSSCSRSSTASSAKAKLMHNLEERSKQRMKIISQLTNQKKEEDDDVDLFMKSIALTIKKLPSQLIPEAKLQILTLVTNLQASSNENRTVTTPAPQPQRPPTTTFDRSREFTQLSDAEETYPTYDTFRYLQ